MSHSDSDSDRSVDWLASDTEDHHTDTGPGRSTRPPPPRPDRSTSPPPPPRPDRSTSPPRPQDHTDAPDRSTSPLPPPRPDRSTSPPPPRPDALQPPPTSTAMRLREKPPRNHRIAVRSAGSVDIIKSDDGDDSSDSKDSRRHCRLSTSVSSDCSSPPPPPPPVFSSQQNFFWATGPVPGHYTTTRGGLSLRALRRTGATSGVTGKPVEMTRKRAAPSPAPGGHCETSRPEQDSDDKELFSRKCAELRCYIQPLSSILRGLRSGRYSQRLSSFQQNVAMDRIQRITGLLQKPHMQGERFLNIVLKMEAMLHSWFPHATPPRGADQQHTHHHATPPRGADQQHTHHHATPPRGADQQHTHHHATPPRGADQQHTHHHATPPRGADQQHTHHHATPPRGATDQQHTHHHATPPRGADQQHTHHHATPPRGADQQHTHHHATPPRGATDQQHTHHHATPPRGATDQQHTHHHATPAKRQKRLHATANPSSSCPSSMARRPLSCGATPPTGPARPASLSAALQVRWPHTCLKTAALPSSVRTSPAAAAAPAPHPSPGTTSAALLLHATQDNAVSSSTDSLQNGGPKSHRHRPRGHRTARRVPFKISSPCLQRLLQAKESIIIGPRTTVGDHDNDDDNGTC